MRILVKLADVYKADSSIFNVYEDMGLVCTHIRTDHTLDAHEGSFWTTLKPPPVHN